MIDLEEWCSTEGVAKIINDLYARCEFARAVGGVASFEVIEGRQVPVGWVYDWSIDYWLPPNLALDAVGNA